MTGGKASAGDAVRGLKRRKPFSPFRIVMTNGESYVIEDPDRLAVTLTQLAYCQPSTERVVILRQADIATVGKVEGRIEERRMIENIKTLKHREPFSPFQIVMTSGDRYLIENPDLLAMGQSELAYYFPKSDRMAFLRIIEIAAVEKLEEKPAA